jgi:hypothetical protein
MEDVIADVETFPQSVSHELNLAMEKSLQLLRTQVEDRTPKNVGTLKGSINHQIISPFPNLVGSVGSAGHPYVLAIEYGRKPRKFPPVDAIRLWVHQKLKLRGKEADSAAFLIARSIAKKGFSPKHAVGPTGARMFEKGLEVSEPHINQLFNSAIARSVQRFNQS